MKKEAQTSEVSNNLEKMPKRNSKHFCFSFSKCLLFCWVFFSDGLNVLNILWILFILFFHIVQKAVNCHDAGYTCRSHSFVKKKNNNNKNKSFLKANNFLDQFNLSLKL